MYCDGRTYDDDERGSSYYDGRGASYYDSIFGDYGSTRGDYNVNYGARYSRPTGPNGAIRAPGPSTNTVTRSDEDNKIRKSVTVRGLFGLKNIGNTCYMNALLQCISASKYFCAYLIKNEFQNDLH